MGISGQGQAGDPALGLVDHVAFDQQPVPRRHILQSPGGPECVKSSVSPTGGSSSLGPFRGSGNLTPPGSMNGCELTGGYSSFWDERHGSDLSP
jgi:hypothetical protein